MRAEHILAAALVLAACGQNAPFHGIVIDPPPEAPVVRLAQAGGSTFDLDAERGRRGAVLFFGYTHCPDVCPATLADWARAKQAMGSAGDAFRWIFVSVDPGRDSPATAQAYATRFDSSFVGLAPTTAQLDTLQQAWGFAIVHETLPGAPEEAYGVGHPAGSFAVDRAGRIRLIFPPNIGAANIASDLRRLR